MEIDNDVRFRFAMLLGKIGRAFWIVVLSIILIITVFYGVILNAFGSQAIAIFLSIFLLAGITLLSIYDVKDEKVRYDRVAKKNGGGVFRASSRKTK